MKQVKLVSSQIVIVLLSLSLLTFCSKKNIFTTKSNTYEQLKVDELVFKYLTLKSKVKIKRASNKKSEMEILIRVEKDSIIWFNISSKLGVQALRGIITRDSIKILNRIEKSYSKYNFNELSSEFQFPIDYNLLQAIILGNMQKSLSKTDIVEYDSSKFIIKQSDKNINIISNINKKTLKLEEVRITEKETDNLLSLLYSDFRNVNNQWYPFSLFISLVYKDKKEKIEVKVYMKNTKVEMSNKLIKFPFSIPKKYEIK